MILLSLFKVLLPKTFPMVSHSAQLLSWKGVMPGFLFVKGPESEV